MIEIVPLSNVEPASVEALLDRAFGADRHARTAYKVRGAAAALPALSFGAVEGDVLVGSIQCWPVTLATDAGALVPLVMVGPIAVEPARQRDGIGRRLVEHALSAAGATDADDALMLIGDPEYYSRFLGFTDARTSHWRLPGPVERHRLLARGDGVPNAAGTLGPRLPVTA